MGYTIEVQAPTTMTLVATVLRNDGKWWNNSSEAWQDAQPSIPSESIALTEGTGILNGIYTSAELTSLGTATVNAYIHDTSNSNLVVGQQGVDLVNSNPLSLASMAVTPDKVADERTFRAGREGNRSNNIVTLNTWSGNPITLAADFSDVLNDGTVMLSVDSVTVTKDSDSSTVATSSLARQTNYKAVNADVAAIATAGTFTVRWDVTAIDGSPLSLTGTLEVE